MRKNSLTRQVRRAYDQGDLARICTLREDRFGRAFGMETVTIPTGRKSPFLWSSSGLPEDYYHFRDNNSSVLAVAHLDTVVRQKGRTPHFRNTERGPLITSGALDDRLGAYVIMRLLPKLGVTCDWLLTVGEESGQSTARQFNPGGKKYDWVIEFDRGGTDVVMYQYEDAASERLLEAAGARMDWGSFSDIAYLEHLGVKAFNWGVGYGGNYHSEAGYAYLEDTFSMVAKYLRFHEQNAGTRLEHDPDARPRYGSGTLSYSGGSYRSSKYDKYGRDDDDYYGKCNSCGEEAVDSVTWYCTACGICADCGGTDPDVTAGWDDADVYTCQCYSPRQRGEQREERQERDDWTGMTWDQYLAQRPGPDSPDDDDADEARYGGPDTKSGTGSRISAAPPWSEHRPDATYGLGVPTSRKRETGPGAAQDASQFLSEYAESYENRLREERKALRKQWRDEARPAVNPPAVFPDADMGWHESARGSDSLFVVAHKPAQAWAQICLRCAARWPHPVSGSADIHPESDCPGCDRCVAANAGLGTGMIHVIPAHLAGESDLCRLCSNALTEADRGSGSVAVRDVMRALDEGAPS